MRICYKSGDQKEYRKKVLAEDRAAFESGTVHEVYSTFSIARDAEWACRLFVLDMKEADEEGIGTFVHVNHHAPALLGEEVCITASVKSLERNEIICSFEVRVGARLIATGEQGQKILKKEKLERLFQNLPT